ncbi:trehalose synthase [Lacihabitans sp. LS3-19]|uniref:maltokinase N-terminal cap-like domain-containing protein n=1 Tax=Lacihabitans sp. LS3-19 TaxID=2487335 RepID=UPI0020CE6D15|nr:trehalose synthase [Lacihabitans sp. LS3-19]MCP9770094.1 trehalose synthase [Lacihabitans sp. LS3-19]
MSKFVLLLDWEGFEKDKYVHTVLEDNLLPNYFIGCRWFAGKARKNWRLKISQVIRMNYEESQYFFAFINVKYPEGDTETYMFPLSFVADDIEGLPSEAIITPASLEEKEGYLVEAVFDPAFREAIFHNIVNSQNILQITNDHLVFERGKGLEDETAIDSIIPDIDSSNTAFVFGGKYFFKLYRKLFAETNPEVEMVQFITQNSDFKNIPRYCGSVTLEKKLESDITIGLLVEVIANEKDNWSKTGDYLNDFMFAFVDGNFQIKENVFEKVGLLGQRTAQMHDALFNINCEEGFRADIFDRPYRRFIHQKVEDLLEHRYNILTENYLSLDEQSQILAWKFMEAKDIILDFVDQILTRPIESFRTRIHGDYHLGQVLVCKEDLVIIDFEGEPESTISSRKVKHSPLKDVAGMIRSYHYAVSAKLFNSPETKSLNEKVLQRATDRWYRLMRDTYLDEYMTYFGPLHPLLKNNNEINYLLQFHLLEKSVYELGYELNYRPSWVKIPLKGILDVILEIEKLNR